jgi:hypothetical protein
MPVVADRPAAFSLRNSREVAIEELGAEAPKRERLRHMLGTIRSQRATVEVAARQLVEGEVDGWEQAAANAAGIRKLVTRSFDDPGKVRVTSVDDHGPVGHIEVAPDGLYGELGAQEFLPVWLPGNEHAGEDGPER